MKHSFILSVIFLSAISFSSFAQQEALTRRKSLNIVKEIKPPVINFVEGSMRLMDPSGNDAIDAQENCKITFKINNTGVGDGLGCMARIRATGSTEGLSYRDYEIPTIKVGETRTVEIPVAASMNTLDGKVDFTIDIYEPNGFGPDPLYLAVNTKKFLSPLIKVTDYTVTGVGAGGVLSKRTPFDLQLLVQNVEHGMAENVNVEISVPEGVYLMDGDKNTGYANMSPGKAESLVYGLIVNNNYTSATIPIKVKITEKYGKFAENYDINLSLNQTLASRKINVQEKEMERSLITIASLTSDVDKNIPQTSVKQDKTFAVIIANENYSFEASVPYAANDGSVFEKYCEQTLGIPKTNIRFSSNATLNVLRNDIDWLRNVIKSYNGEAKAIFYYAGHGIPDEASGSAYLLPIDGSGNNFRTGYKLDELYSSLSEFPAKSVAVFLDACFSGTKREGGMLSKNGRGIAIEVEEGTVDGNMVVFSASQGDQTAYPYSDKGHGMFTYFLLKKLQESGGKVNFNDLESYIQINVSQKSIVLNGKSQTPKVTPSSSLGAEWRGWSLMDK
jgi:hypothetical protein